MSGAPSVTVAPGVVVDATMSATERHNAIARAMGAQTVERTAAPPQFHTPATLQRLEQGERDAAARAPVPIASRGLDPADFRPTGAQPQGQRSAPVEIDEAAFNKLNEVYRALGPEERELYRPVYERDMVDIVEGRKLGESREAFRARVAAGKPPETAPRHAGLAPPSPEELAAQNDGSALEQFDADMRARGLQTAQPEPSHLVVDERTGIAYDPRAVERCTELFRALPADEREAARQEYQDTLAEIYAGKLGLADMEDNSAPGKPARASNGQFAPAETKPAEAPASDDGWIPIENLTLEHTSGYTIPRYVDDQTLSADALGLLKQARAAGISQEQIDAVLRQHAVEKGWVRA